ncbi:hypothetical protein, partial [Arthrobacter sp. H20]|uniref:hypothetical protein n=1 Tax=Arthrobacter sp. H20 TaxID=1267981 RepID=UPI00055B0201
MVAANLSRMLAGLDALISDRLAGYLDPSGKPTRPLGGYRFEPSQFAGFNDGRELSPAEHVVMLLALVPHIRPDFFGRLIGAYLPDGGDLPEFGGDRAEHHRGVLPTGETAQFVLAGDDLAGRLEVQRLLSSEHWFARRRVLWLDNVR